MYIINQKLFSLQAICFLFLVFTCTLLLKYLGFTTVLLVRYIMWCTYPHHIHLSKIQVEHWAISCCVHVLVLRTVVCFNLLACDQCNFWYTKITKLRQRLNPRRKKSLAIQSGFALTFWSALGAHPETVKIDSTVTAFVFQFNFFIF